VIKAIITLSILTLFLSSGCGKVETPQSKNSSNDNEVQAQKTNEGNGQQLIKDEGKIKAEGKQKSEIKSSNQKDGKPSKNIELKKQELRLLRLKKEEEPKAELKSLKRKATEKAQSDSKQEDYLSKIDKILEELDFGNIVFNVPSTINIKNTAVIQLLLGMEVPLNELKQNVVAEGEIVGASIQVSNRMQARLSGPNFSITTITPEEQAVSRKNITEWKWEIKPITSGRHYLHLTLSVVLIVEGTSSPRVIRTFDKLIAIEITWYQRTGLFFQNNWHWLWTALLVPIGGWLWKKKKGSKPKDNLPTN